MSEIERRDFLKGTAAFAAGVTAALAATGRAAAGDPSFMNNVPDPLLAGESLPTFKFALERSQGRVTGQCIAKEASVRQLPISKGLSLIIDLVIALPIVVIVILLYGVGIASTAWLVPAFLLLGVVTAFSLLTDALRDALDPKLR